VKALPAKTLVERSIGKKIDSITNPGDRIFVWGHSSDVYYYSKRLPASRFTYCSFLSGAQEGYEDGNRAGSVRQDVWALLVNDLGARRPAAMVDMSGTDIRGYRAYPMQDFEPLKKFVRRSYKVADIVDRAVVWKK
jgi:hypothetical protein